MEKSSLKSVYMEIEKLEKELESCIEKGVGSEELDRLADEIVEKEDDLIKIAIGYLEENGEHEGKEALIKIAEMSEIAAATQAKKLARIL